MKFVRGYIVFVIPSIRMFGPFIIFYVQKFIMISHFDSSYLGSGTGRGCKLPLLFSLLWLGPKKCILLHIETKLQRNTLNSLVCKYSFNCIVFQISVGELINIWLGGTNVCCYNHFSNTCIPL